MKTTFSKRILTLIALVVIMCASVSICKAEIVDDNMLSNIQKKAIIHTMYWYMDETGLPLSNIQFVDLIEFPEGYSKRIYFSDTGYWDVDSNDAFVVISHKNQNGEDDLFICFCNIHIFEEEKIGSQMNSLVHALEANTMKFRSSNWPAALLNHIVTYNPNDFTEIVIMPQTAIALYNSYDFVEDSFTAEPSLTSSEIAARTMECELCGSKALCQYTTRLELSFWVCPSCREWMLAD